MKYRKKPIFVEANQFLCDLLGIDRIVPVRTSETFLDYPVYCDRRGAFIVIPTRAGALQVYKGDLILTGENGERYHCERAEFEATYDKVMTVDEDCSTNR